MPQVSNVQSKNHGESKRTLAARLEIAVTHSCFVPPKDAIDPNEVSNVAMAKQPSGIAISI
jgi:hypothetical protein